jgi:hypothetical protein
MMDDKTRADYLWRMQEGMRPMTEAEIADMQRRQAPLMMNCQDHMRGAAGMQNFWASEPAHWIPEPPKLTFWQRMKRLFVRHNVEVSGLRGFLRRTARLSGWASGPYRS